MQLNKQSVNLTREFWVKFNIISKEINSANYLFQRADIKCIHVGLIII